MTVANYCYNYLAKQHVSALTRPSSGLKNSGVSQGTFSGFHLWDPTGTFSGFYLWDPIGTFSGFYYGIP